jgi:hypothetical protein
VPNMSTLYQARLLESSLPHSLVSRPILSTGQFFPERFHAMVQPDETAHWWGSTRSRLDNFVGLAFTGTCIGDA